MVLGSPPWAPLSRPSRARGLKLVWEPPGAANQLVAPLTGAWIETFPSMPDLYSLAVAPLTGAWIETRPGRAASMHNVVAPLAGAWIETVPNRFVGSCHYSSIAHMFDLY